MQEHEDKLKILQKCTIQDGHLLPRKSPDAVAEPHAPIIEQVVPNMSQASHGEYSQNLSMQSSKFRQLSEIAQTWARRVTNLLQTLKLVWLEGLYLRRMCPA